MVVIDEGGAVPPRILRALRRQARPRLRDWRAIVSRRLLDTVERHKSGEALGIYSVCSAHPLVIEASVLRALDDDGYLLVEATSNQVDQFGGYTGMKPQDFRRLVLGLARRHGLPEDRIVLGGDHLGPNRWQERPAEEALAYAGDLVASYVAAGFTKLHLDCSMPCADDTSPLDDKVVAKRAARLANKAEQEASARSQAPADDLVYVVGTEVPVPGGAHEALERLTPTSADAARTTLAAHEAAFYAEGLEGAWNRVIALVVQPGVEFDLERVVDYDRSATGELRRVLDDRGRLVFEAHSTDYQTRANLRDLVEDHWAVLKVGPALTFAMREALFALAAIEDELVAEGQRSELLSVVEHRMQEEPGYWEGYYPGDPATKRLLRRYSYSDRIRYYWSYPDVEDARKRLFSNLAAREIPQTLLSQYLPRQYERMRQGRLAGDPEALVFDRIRETLQDYVVACKPKGEEARIWADI
ncbi:MAG: D-tagatose-1,6-bisphosphate aldolase subunit KbaZ [uncultured Rubrobacteraceae bacterium]|uniref:D-tagatose-1,6-bisphosphate aldolase subunit KbaZ n=1 Tax=uncultured Rubrobacteraceae bacterium TaxID=349277 RepID=A0A6J4REY9_9ACTN|nr:MAG: D-tagatose-1,6-bisphosphate aldolase subunit KbaZ [uncultured Rubrobacteraceae bacterium]